MKTFRKGPKIRPLPRKKEASPLTNNPGDFGADSDKILSTDRAQRKRKKRRKRSKAPPHAFSKVRSWNLLATGHNFWRKQTRSVSLMATYVWSGKGRGRQEGYQQEGSNPAPCVINRLIQGKGWFLSKPGGFYQKGFFFAIVDHILK